MCQVDQSADGGGGGAAGASGQGGRGGGQGGNAPACVSGQAVLRCDVTNARDLGGIRLATDQSVACGALFRGGPLADLSDAGCSSVAALGIRTIIDLRIPDEISTRPDSDCLSATASTVLAPLPVPYSVSAEDYIADLNAIESIASVFRVLGDPASYPIYFHCTWGRDRTGIVAAVILLTLGASRTDIMNDYLLSQPSVGAYPSSLQAAMNEIDRRGGVEAYLAAAGVTSEQIATLRSRAIAP